jgi:hypothetical protein
VDSERTFESGTKSQNFIHIAFDRNISMRNRGLGLKQQPERKEEEREKIRRGRREDSKTVDSKEPVLSEKQSLCAYS